MDMQRNYKGNATGMERKYKGDTKEMHWEYKGNLSQTKQNTPPWSPDRAWSWAWTRASWRTTKRTPLRRNLLK